MQNIQKKDVGKSTYELTIIVSKDVIAKESEKAFEALCKTLKLSGFREGKVPKDVAKKHIKNDDIYKRALDELLPSIYKDAIAQENLKPIVSPKIRLNKTNTDEDWEIAITVAEKPSVKLGDYKTFVKNLKAEQKKDDIWVPGKSTKKGDERADNVKKNRLMNKILDLLIKRMPIELSDMIIEAEMDKRMTQLVDDVRKVGLTIERYLQSKGQTMESLQAKMKTEIAGMYALEFILEEIAEQEKITVDNADLEEVFSSIKKKEERAQAQKNAYFYASMLKRQKTLDFLLSL